MLTIHSTTAFEIVNKAEFDAYMRENVPKWKNWLESHNEEQSLEPDIQRRAVDLSFAEVLRDHPECLRMTTAFDLRSFHLVNMLSSFNARAAPELFRAMFAEV